MRLLTKEGFRVVVEAGAGQAASFTDAAYEEAGATVVSGGDAWKADIVVKVRDRGGGGDGGAGGGVRVREVGQRRREGGREGERGRKRGSGGREGRAREGHREPPFLSFGASDCEGRQQ